MKPDHTAICVTHGLSQNIDGRRGPDYLCADAARDGSGGYAGWWWLIVPNGTPTPAVGSVVPPGTASRLAAPSPLTPPEPNAPSSDEQIAEDESGEALGGGPASPQSLPVAALTAGAARNVEQSGGPSKVGPQSANSEESDEEENPATAAAGSQAAEASEEAASAASEEAAESAASEAAESASVSVAEG